MLSQQLFLPCLAELRHLVQSGYTFRCIKPLKRFSSETVQAGVRTEPRTGVNSSMGRVNCSRDFRTRRIRSTEERPAGLWGSLWNNTTERRMPAGVHYPDSSDTYWLSASQATTRPPRELTDQIQLRFLYLLLSQRKRPHVMFPLLYGVLI